MSLELYRLSSFLHLVQPREAGGFQAQAPADWSQGRTLYGGATAALCAQAAGMAFPELPPLRSTQFCFIGPSQGGLVLTPRSLRQGRSSRVVEVEVQAVEGIAAKAVLVYGAARESALEASCFASPTVEPPEACQDFFAGPGAPTFTQHFEFRKAGGADPVSGAEQGDFLVWVRHREPGTVDPAAALLAIADALPPAAMAMFTKLAPVSSLTWSFDLLSDQLPRPSEWLLLSSVAESTAHGYSFQKMAIWDRDGRPVASGRQQVTVFC